MRKKTIVYAVLIVMLFAAAAPAFAQVKGALTVQCDVIGARVYLNGEIAGYARPNFSILLTPGQYKLRVSMPGYSDYETTINMTSNPKIINVNLRSPQQYSLGINANVQGADVYINDRRVGQTPYRDALPAGSYSVRVSAGGYNDAYASVNLQSSQNINLSLQPRMIDVSIQIGESSFIRNIYNWDNQLRVFVDGSRVQGVNFQVTPGRHTIRIETGIFRIERTVDFSLGNGSSRTLTLRLELD